MHQQIVQNSQQDVWEPQYDFGQLDLLWMRKSQWLLFDAVDQLITANISVSGDGPKNQRKSDLTAVIYVIQTYRIRVYAYNR